MKEEEGARWTNSLVPDEAADRNSSPAHATHEAAGHEAPGERLAPGPAALVTVGVLDVHGDGLCADEGVLSTAAHGRVERTGCHVEGFSGGWLRRRGWLGRLEEVVKFKVVEVDVAVTVGDPDNRRWVNQEAGGQLRAGSRGRRQGGVVATRGASRNTKRLGGGCVLVWVLVCAAGERRLRSSRLRRRRSRGQTVWPIEAVCGGRMGCRSGGGGGGGVVVVVVGGGNSCRRRFVRRRRHRRRGRRRGRQCYGSSSGGGSEDGGG